MAASLRSLVKVAMRHVPEARLFSMANPAWIEEWLSKVREASPPPEKYLPTTGLATADTVFARMTSIGNPHSRLNRDALHYLLRSCYRPSDIEVSIFLAYCGETVIGK
jgi:hypothetical protein